MRYLVRVTRYLAEGDDVADIEVEVDDDDDWESDDARWEEAKRLAVELASSDPDKFFGPPPGIEYHVSVLDDSEEDARCE